MLLFVFPLTVFVLQAGAGVWQFPTLVPGTFSSRGVQYLIDHSASIIRSTLISLGYSFLTVVVTLLMTITPALLFARYSFRGKIVLETLLLAPALLPSIAFSIGVHFIFLQLHIVNSFAGVVLILSIFSYPYMLRALIAGFLIYGSEFNRCATNLGATPLQTIVRVDIPLLVPSIISGGTIVFLVSFSEYFLVLLIGGGAVDSLTGFMFPFLNSGDRTIASILTLYFLLIPILLFFIIDLSINRLYRKMGMI